MIAPEIEKLIQLFSRLPGLGSRSARRVVLHLLDRRDSLMTPLVTALEQAAERLTRCSLCGTLDVDDPCSLCRDPKRDTRVICVVEDVADLWAIERSGAFKGYYVVLGGTLSALDGRGPQQLRMGLLYQRLASDQPPQEIILALSATVDGQTTAHYIAESLAGAGHGVRVTRLGHGVPVGGELNYLDDGTLAAAFRARRSSGEHDPGENN